MRQWITQQEISDKLSISREDIENALYELKLKNKETKEPTALAVKNKLGRVFNYSKGLDNYKICIWNTRALIILKTHIEVQKVEQQSNSFEKFKEISFQGINLYKNLEKNMAVMAMVKEIFYPTYAREEYFYTKNGMVENKKQNLSYKI